MPGISSVRRSQFRDEFEKIYRILEACKTVDATFMAPTEEFLRRQQAVTHALGTRGLDVGFVFSDEHYNGDVPYLGGNTNISIEQVAGAIGPQGFHIIAG